MMRTTREGRSKIADWIARGGIRPRRIRPRVAAGLVAACVVAPHVRQAPPLHAPALSRQQAASTPQGAPQAPSQPAPAQPAPSQPAPSQPTPSQPPPSQPPPSQPATPPAATPAAPVANYDERKVPAYTLPDPLRLESGERVTDAQTWEKKRRPELLELFETQVYGRSARAPTGMRFVTRRVERQALNGLATRKEIAVFFTGAESGPHMDLLIYIPNAPAGQTSATTATGSAAAAGTASTARAGGAAPSDGTAAATTADRKVPAFLGLNFTGNHTVHADPGITLPTVWTRGPDGKYTSATARDAARGSSASRWPVELILSRGFALVTAYYGDLEPDFPEGWREGGVRTTFTPAFRAEPRLPPKATPAEISALDSKVPKDHGLDRWGALGVWAWGMSRALDYLETDADIDAKRVALIGHSRIGKATLWAGAQDPRFALVVANESGEGGAAITRRKFGEQIARITTAFPHWFCGMFSYYQDREELLPVDFHELVALIAPRPVYIASAEQDQWADPRGEFLSAKAAQPVYRLFGKDGLGVDDMPAVDTPVGRTIGYHMRRGKHDVTQYDWEQYLTFASRHLP